VKFILFTTLRKRKSLFVESQVNVCLDVTANIWVFYVPPFNIKKL